MACAGPAALAALAVLLLGLNAVGYGAVRSDKRRAQRGARRVPERLLHLLGFLAAWPGCALAMLAERHKTRKPRFLVPFALASLAGTLLAAWLVAAAARAC